MWYICHHCAAPENIYTHPKEVHRKFQGGGRSEKQAETSRGVDGWGIQTKQPYVRGVYIFSEKTCLIYIFSLYFRKDAFFVDLFVRMSNNVAVDMYKQLGYVIYRRVLEYYSGDPDEDAFGEKMNIFYKWYDMKNLL